MYILSGDFNVDFNHPSGSLKTLATMIWLQPIPSFNTRLALHIKEIIDGSCKAWPDHILCDSFSFSNFILFCKVDSGSNLSDHHPVVTALSFNYSVTSQTPCHHLNASESELNGIVLLVIFIATY